jgi:endonuclease/exonuclease/phosphatase family metal-dependent hydrolase
MSLRFLAALVLTAGLQVPVPAPLTIMTFNIRYGTANDGPNRWELRRDHLIQVVKTHDPDVIGLQEALHFQIDEMLAAMPDYRMVGVGRSDGGHGGEYAAILYRASRLSVRRTETFWFSDTPDIVKSNTWGAALERICTWALFDGTGGGHWRFQYRRSESRDAGDGEGVSRHVSRRASERD